VVEKYPGIRLGESVAIQPVIEKQDHTVKSCGTVSYVLPRSEVLGGMAYSPDVGARIRVLTAQLFRCRNKLCSEFGQSCRMDAPAPAVLRAKLKVRYFELSVPALPRCPELLLDEAGIVVPHLCLERLLQPEQRTRVAWVVV
jgi:hypothetical protein